MSKIETGIAVDSTIGEMNRSMTLPENYPAQYERLLTLNNGREVYVRPILPADEGLIVDLFERLSSQSVYLRFLRDLPALPQDMLYQFTHVNYSSDLALVGLVKEDDRDALIAVARYASTPPGDLTDLAVAVRDDWQRLGLGKALLRMLVEIGKEHGIHHYSGMIDPKNKTIMKILTDLGYRVTYTLRDGFFEVDILTQ